MPEPMVLAVHITIALALTMTVGVQSSQLARLPMLPDVRALRAALWSTSILALLTFVTGIAVLADGKKGGPWLSAGVLSALAMRRYGCFGGCAATTSAGPGWWAQSNGVYPP